MAGKAELSAQVILDHFQRPVAYETQVGPAVISQ